MIWWKRSNRHPNRSRNIFLSCIRVISLKVIRTYLKIATLADTALKTGSKCSCTAVYTPLFTPGILPSALAGQLKLFKIAPGDFVARFRLVSPVLA